MIGLIRVQRERVLRRPARTSRNLFLLTRAGIRNRPSTDILPSARLRFRSLTRPLVGLSLPLPGSVSPTWLTGLYGFAGEFRDRVGCCHLLFSLELSRPRFLSCPWRLGLFQTAGGFRDRVGCREFLGSRVTLARVAHRVSGAIDSMLATFACCACHTIPPVQILGCAVQVHL